MKEVHISVVEDSKYLDFLYRNGGTFYYTKESLEYHATDSCNETVVGIDSLGGIVYVRPSMDFELVGMNPFLSFPERHIDESENGETMYFVANGNLDVLVHNPFEFRKTRKSYASSIRKNKDFIEIRMIDVESYDDYVEFHMKIKGDVRSQSLYDAGRHLVDIGYEKIFVAIYEGEIVGAVSFYYFNRCMHYNSAAIDHEVKKFQNHILIDHVISKYESEYIELGSVDYSSEKMKSITFFKKGFANDIFKRLIK